MQKKFISSLFLLVLVNVLIKPLAIFGIDIPVQNRVGSEAYGLYFSLLNFSMLFNILLDFGINNFTTKNVAQNPKMATKYFGRILGFRFILFIFYSVFCFSIALALDYTNYEIYLLSFLLLNQLLSTLIAYSRSFFGGLLLFKTDAIISVLDRLILILICGYLLFIPNDFGPFQIEWFIWIQTLCYLLTVLISFYILLRQVRLSKVKLKVNISYAIIKQSFPYALLVLLMMIYTRTDSVMIERILDDGKLESGYYAKGFRLVNAFFMFAMLFSNLLYPLFSRMLNKGENIKPLFVTSSRLLIASSFVISIVCFFNSQEVLAIVYNSDVIESGPSFQFIMLSFIGMCSTIIFGTFLTAKGDLKLLNIVSAIGILINLVANFLLIPKYGAYGAAITTFGTQTLVSIIQFFICKRYLNFKIIHIDSFKFLLFVVLITLVFWQVNISSILGLIGMISLSFLLLIPLKIVDINLLKNSLKFRNK